MAILSSLLSDYKNAMVEKEVLTMVEVVYHTSRSTPSVNTYYERFRNFETCWPENSRSNAELIPFQHTKNIQTEVKIILMIIIMGPYKMIIM